ncbi:MULTISPECIES: 3-ketoacyl-CoA thiolase [unclassified Novosphingobium]|uniref:thiolase C-terminal domain-containing protein n=1 Tax=unclassified Novosphingobium TaxID=2644732 RepID=UPI00145BC611|nr:MULTISPECIES: 3-ketoacyl-CoA thiolase [unclassified Novosphingobium]MBB3359975.1 acetyl-CoA C-acetyltransferase [Novosphingobium sp. BK256]MBB3376334.1 acetyl-CoA C-acetyltransferase [Novosphingobium sp. BK280]MBB3380785.1 acetyl-CoA C-acetyltransferase [Novosphingobium sp. BK258]MBB3422399.1 acetyl-CoA C-acetyltransferase [Novosphingobium sp. BK267]MBB3451136.1 acetyl-CoA C-acetyltransferase [Novosphingobium sp. BK352]
MGLSKVAVLASAQTELRPAWRDAQHIDLISSVVANVFKGTGLTLDDVDFVIDSGSDVLDGRSISNCGFLGALGAHHKEEARVEEDGLWGALYGVNKIRSGASSIGLIVAYSKPSESDIDLYWSAMVEPFYQRPVGFGQKAALGIQAQRYLAAHGITDEALAAIVAKRWADAAANGKVAIDTLPDAAAVLAGDEAAWPLTDLMISRPLDGAVAVLICNEDVARRTGRPPVFITGMGTSLETHNFADRSINRLDSVAAATRMALGKAGWDKAAADVVETSGSSVVGELLALEGLGLAAAGRGAEIALDPAVNASGGALPADPIMATGLVRLAEAAKRLSTPVAAGAKAPATALVHGTGGVAMQTNCVFTLEV